MIDMKYVGKQYVACKLLNFGAEKRDDVNNFVRKIIAKNK